MIDRVTARLGRNLVDVPVGFEWFIGGLLSGSLCFPGEQNTGTSFARRDGRVWSTDKDGILLAAEIYATTGRDSGESHRALVEEMSGTYYTRLDTPATRTQKTQQ